MPYTTTTAIPYLARVVLVNPTLDIALLGSVDHDFSALPELNLAADDSLSISNKIRVAGYPYRMPFLTEGTVSSPEAVDERAVLSRTDAAVTPATPAARSSTKRTR